MYIRYGHEKLYFHVPGSWDPAAMAEFEDRPVVNNADELAVHALNNPVGTPGLEKLLQPCSRVAVLIEDSSRNSPKKYILKVLLEYLEEIGIRKDSISVIVALGTHRELTGPELAKTYGESTVKRYRFYNHNCMADDLVYTGRLKSGTPVKINRIAFEADFRIGIGSVFPHPLNGFGGGGKILFPGIADFEAILEHHLKYSFRKRVLGCLDENPFYDEVSKAAGAGKLNFIINSVLDHNDNPCAIVAGHPVLAHRKGADICRKAISRKFSRKSDITIISAFPYTQATQLMKPLEPASVITKEQGVIILAGKCTTGFPVEYLDTCHEFIKKYKGRLGETLFDYFDRNKRIIPQGAPELNMSLAQVLLANDKYRVILFSREPSSEDIQKLGFEHAKTIEEAIDMAGRYVKNPVVNIVPSGGVIIPEMEQDL